MDSANSGSLQSSSGADEEYDSRAAAAADSVSAFITGGPISNPPPFFDPLSNYLHLHQNPIMAGWPRTSAPPLPPSSGSNNHIPQDSISPMLSASPAFMPPSQPPVGRDNISPAAPLPPQNQNQGAARNPKKRSRASRRAPTTVLTTDTTNFRAMVQEFTGIPAQPFHNSAFPRTRFDFLGTRSASSEGAAQRPPYLRRPFAQKVQHSLPFLASSSSLFGSTAAMDAALATSSTSANNSIAAVSSSTAANQLPLTQTSNLFNLNPNPLFTSLLQSNLKFPFSNSPQMGSKSQVGSFEILSSSDNQFGALGRGNHVPATLSGLPINLPSDHENNANTNNAARWSNYQASSDVDKDNLRSVNGGFSFRENDFSGTSKLSFPGEKEPENVAAARGEGMLESWICSSE